MSELNYLRIAQILGGTLTEIETPTFGCFGASQVSAERFRLLPRASTGETAGIDPRHYPQIAGAFEKVRNGYEPDRVLVDPVLYKRFIQEVRRGGVKAPEVLINKRLQAFRKASGYGIKLKKTTRDAGLEAEPFFYAAELGFVQLTYRRDVSVDDVITDPEIGEEFVSLCKSIAPHGTGMIFKWAALRLRKMRYFSPDKTQKLIAIESQQIEQELEVVGRLDHLSLVGVPNDTGVFAFSERNHTDKYLYVGSSENLREAVEPFREAEPFKAVAGRFWKPSLGNISLRIAVVKKKLFGLNAREMSLRLIEERHPLFNMPVHLAA